MIIAISEIRCVWCVLFYTASRLRTTGRPCATRERKKRRKILFSLFAGKTLANHFAYIPCHWSSRTSVLTSPLHAHAGSPRQPCRPRTPNARALTACAASLILAAHHLYLRHALCSSTHYLRHALCRVSRHDAAAGGRRAHAARAAR
jgi:hypothetical protein